MSVNLANSGNTPPTPYPAGHPSQRDVHCYTNTKESLRLSCQGRGEKLKKMQSIINFLHTQSNLSREKKHETSIKIRTMCRNTVQSLHLLTAIKKHKEEQQAKTNTGSSV